MPSPRRDDQQAVELTEEMTAAWHGQWRILGQREGGQNERSGSKSKCDQVGKRERKVDVMEDK